MTFRIAVLSDIHGNADALALALADAEVGSADQIVILGDLLTYGMQPNSVLTLLDEVVANRPDIVFISGNHDAFYFGLESGDAGFYPNVPQFVRDTVYWTQEQIAGAQPLSQRYPWVKSQAINGVFHAHANPYEYGDWSYVSDVSSQSDAASILRRSGYRVGVFGHSHRAFAVIVKENEVRPFEQRSWHELPDGAVVLVNPGAVGHPRGTGLSYAILDVDAMSLRVDIRAIPADFEPHRRAISEGDFSPQTRAKLISYLEP